MLSPEKQEKILKATKEFSDSLEIINKSLRKTATKFFKLDQEEKDDKRSAETFREDSREVQRDRES